jgi:hypothetical protein
LESRYRSVPPHPVSFRPSVRSYGNLTATRAVFIPAAAEAITVELRWWSSPF